MPHRLVEIEGPGGLAKIAEKDVNRYLRKRGYKLANTPKTPKKAAKEQETESPEEAVEQPEAVEDTEETQEISLTEEQPADNLEADLAAAAEQDEDGFKTLLKDIETMNTPELEMIVDEYDLGVSLSRERLVADRRVVVLKALKAKVKAARG
jgi:hypothetical protein